MIFRANVASVRKLICLAGIACWWSFPNPAAGQTTPSLDLRPHAGLSIMGVPGSAVTVEYATHLSPTIPWLVFTNIVLTNSPCWLANTVPPATGNCFYRLQPSPPPPIPNPANLLWIPPGTFMMGSPESEPERETIEGPQTQVTISRGFWMSKFELTQGEYLAMTGSNPSYLNGDRSGPPYNDHDYGIDLTRAVEMVSWQEATNYCALLTAQERAAGHISTNLCFRLPTEAEWEYACRAGTTTAFHYGTALLDPMANFFRYWEYDSAVGNIILDSADFLDCTTPVGSFTPNAFGLYDMHGNVWEWCSDWFGPSYPGGSVTDPQGPATGSERVIRGGSWINYAMNCRSAKRNHHGQEDRYDFLGLRVVLAQTQP